MNYYASATETILTKARTIITCRKKQIILFFLAYGLLPAALAAAPLWTMLPAPGSNPTQSLTANSTATVQYIVQNQSAKAKQLAIIAIPGITQTSPCLLAPKGQNGSSCILNLSISGSDLPEGGIHGGPSLCVTDTQGKPNPNQCYQPTAANSLNISKTATTAQLSVTPTVLMFTVNTTASLTVVNNASSTVAAEQINAAIPPGSTISVQNNGCPSTLAVGGSCVITLTSAAAEGPTPISVSGSNTNTVSISATVTSTPIALLSVSPSTLTFTENTTGMVSITNSFGSPVAAQNIVSTIPVGSAITEQANTCGPSLAVGVSCQITFTSSSVEGPTAVTIGGTNTTNEPVNITVSATPNAAISINPSTLAFNAGDTASITVTNTAGSPAIAQNITASIPTGSPITFTNNCPVALPTNNACTIDFTSLTRTPETAITINGTNTNTEQANITVTPSCIPITTQTVPSVSIVGSTNTSDLPNAIDSDLDNFATIVSPLNIADDFIEISNLSYATGAVYGVKLSNNSSIPGGFQYSLRTYKNGVLQTIEPFTVQADQTTTLSATTISSEGFDAIRIIPPMAIISNPYTTSVFYFCAGQ